MTIRPFFSSKVIIGQTDTEPDQHHAKSIANAPPPATVAACFATGGAAVVLVETIAAGDH